MKWRRRKKHKKNPNKKQKQTNKQTKNKKKKRKIRQYLFKRFINQSPSMSEYTYVDLQFFVRNLGEKCNFMMLQFSPIWNERIKCHFVIFPQWHFPPHSKCDDVPKIEPTKIHLVSQICELQGFVSGVLYRMVTISYFYRILNVKIKLFISFVKGTVTSFSYTI